jgi:hypothetical protein
VAKLTLQVNPVLQLHLLPSELPFEVSILLQALQAFPEAKAEVLQEHFILGASHLNPAVSLQSHFSLVELFLEPTTPEQGEQTPLADLKVPFLHRQAKLAQLKPARQLQATWLEVEEDLLTVEQLLQPPVWVTNCPALQAQALMVEFHVVGGRHSQVRPSVSRMSGFTPGSPTQDEQTFPLM